jgi:hypothetical protein
VASLAGMILKAKEKLSQDLPPTESKEIPVPALSSLDHPHHPSPAGVAPAVSSGHQNSQKQLTKKSKPPTLHPPQMSTIPSGAVATAAVKRSNGKKESLKPSQRVGEKEGKESERDKRRSQLPKKRQAQEKKATKKVELRGAGGGGEGDGEEEEEDDDSVVEKYFSMKRKANGNPSDAKPKPSHLPQPAGLGHRQVSDEEGSVESPSLLPQSLEYAPASPMFPLLSDEEETFPLDLPVPVKKSSPLLIDPTPLDLSYFNSDQTALLDHRSHSILEGDEEDEGGEEGEGGGMETQASFDRSNYVIPEDEEEEEEEGEGERQEGERVDYEDDFEEGNEGNHSNSDSALLAIPQSLSGNSNLPNNQIDDSDLQDPLSLSQHSMFGGCEEREGDGEGDDGSEGTGASDDYEKLLNMECENLRRRLEEKILLSQSSPGHEGEEEGEEEEREDGEGEEEGEGEYDDDDYEDDEEEGE